MASNQTSEATRSEETKAVGSQSTHIPQRLTRRQAAIIGAYTGITVGPFGDIHKYVDSLPGFEGIGTISFADKGVWEQIRRACRDDFMAIVSEKTQPDDVLQESQS